MADKFIEYVASDMFNQTTIEIIHGDWQMVETPVMSNRRMRLQVFRRKLHRNGSNFRAYFIKHIQKKYAVPRDKDMLDAIYDVYKQKCFDNLVYND